MNLFTTDRFQFFSRSQWCFSLSAVWKSFRCLTCGNPDLQSPGALSTQLCVFSLWISVSVCKSEKATQSWGENIVRIRRIISHKSLMHSVWCIFLYWHQSQTLCVVWMKTPATNRLLLKIFFWEHSYFKQSCKAEHCC